jgi:hypothetical protein
VIVTSAKSSERRCRLTIDLDARTLCISCFLNTLKQVNPDAVDLDSVLHFPWRGGAAMRPLIVLRTLDCTFSKKVHHDA